MLKTLTLVHHIDTDEVPAHKRLIKICDRTSACLRKLDWSGTEKPQTRVTQIGMVAGPDRGGFQ